MKTLSKKIKIVFIFVTVVFLSIYWFSDTVSIGLDMDEVYYILNSRFYFYRKQGKFEAFTLPSTHKKLPWLSLQNQMLDQPQLEKYIIGFILETSDANPWEKTDPNWLYAEFASFNLPVGKKLHQITNYLGTEMVKAITIIRYVSAVAGLTSLMLFGYVISRITNNIFIGAFAFGISTLHPLMRQFLRIATTNSFSLLFLLLSSFLILYILKKLKSMSFFNLFMASLFLGTLIAATTSIKINGMLLLLFPIGFIFLKTIHRKKYITLNKSQLKQFLVFTTSAALGFISTFYYLEPELWKNPVKGIYLLLTTRLAQQERFYRHIGKMSFPQISTTFINSFLSISANPIIKVLLIALLLTGAIELIKTSKKDYNNKILFYFLVFVLVTNAYYARVIGFYRYLIPSILVAILISSIGAKKLLSTLKAIS